MSLTGVVSLIILFLIVGVFLKFAGKIIGWILYAAIVMAAVFAAVYMVF